MGIFDKLGGNLIADRIRTEAQKAIDRYVESAVVNALLPHGDGLDASARVGARLELVLAETEVTYTEHMGHHISKSLTLPATEKILELETVFPVRRPRDMAESEAVSVEDLDLHLAGKIGGLGFRQMMMGVGATIDSVSFRVRVTGAASLEWLSQPVPETEKKS